jgi:hypothetical protein
VFTSSSLSQNDKVTCKLISQSKCKNPLAALSSPINVQFVNTKTPSVSITSDKGQNILKGQVVKFTAESNNPGSAPIYKWYKNSVLINGASGSIYTTSNIVNNDIFEVDLISNDTCINMPVVRSDFLMFYVYTPSGINTIDNQGVHIYPNPNAGYFNIEFLNNLESKVLVEVYNTIGQLIYAKDLDHKNKLHLIDIDKNLITMEGNYTLKIKGDNFVIHKIFSIIR